MTARSSDRHCLQIFLIVVFKGLKLVCKRECYASSESIPSPTLLRCQNALNSEGSSQIGSQTLDYSHDRTNITLGR